VSGRVRGRSWWLVASTLLLLVQVALAGCVRAKPPLARTPPPAIAPERPPVVKAYPPPTTPIPTLELPSPIPTLVLPPPTATLVPPISTPAPEVMPTITPLPTGDVLYTVQRSDTLIGIARRYGTTVQAIMDRNGIRNPNFIYAGQKLVIPIGYVPQVTAMPQVAQHRVRRGETLSSISRRYRTSVAEILALNPGIVNPNYLPVGTLLQVPLNTQPPMLRHRVRYGETLTSIARRYRVSVQSLIVANGLWDPNHVYVGQVLLIPR
jgi:LysM repeat protein